MNKVIVVVLGMHRSGTSVISAGLASAGGGFGNELMGCSKYNLKGHWEDNDVVSLNNRVLAFLNLSWDSIDFIESSLWNSTKLSSLIEEAASLISKKATSVNGTFAFKDPRTIRILPFWLKVFKTLNVEPKFVFAFRNPNDVAVSLKRRENKTHMLSQFIWLHHNLSTINVLLDSGDHVSFVDFYDFCKAPSNELERLANELGFEPNRHALSEFSSEFYDSSLVTRHTDPYQLSVNKELLTLSFDLYRLLRLAKSEPSVRSKLREKSDIWQVVGPHLCELYGVLAQQLNSQAQQLSNQAHQIADLQSLKNDKHLEDHQIALNELRSIVCSAQVYNDFKSNLDSVKDELLAKQQINNASLKQSLNDICVNILNEHESAYFSKIENEFETQRKHQTLNKKHFDDLMTKIAKLNNQNDTLQRSVSEHKMALFAYQNSLSWLVTKPFRFLASFFVKK